MKKLLLCLIACLLATTTLIAQDKTLNLSILIDKKIERTNQEKERLLREIRNVISNDYGTFKLVDRDVFSKNNFLKVRD